MQEQTSLKLNWRSFSGHNCDVVASIVGCKGGQYFDYVPHRPSRFVIIRLTRPNIVYSLLTLSSWMGQRACHFAFYPQKRPIQSHWKDVTMQPYRSWRCKTWNRWCSVDTHLNYILTVIGWSPIVCQNGCSHYWQPIYRFCVYTFPSRSFESSQFLIYQ